jgi:hypothetical protein
LNGQVLPCRLDALREGLALLFEIVHLFLRQDFEFPAIGEGGFGEEMNLNWVFEVDERGTLWSIRVHLHITTLVAATLGLNGRAYRIIQSMVLLEVIHYVAAITFDKCLAARTESWG